MDSLADNPHVNEARVFRSTLEFDPYRWNARTKNVARQEVKRAHKNDSKWENGTTKE